MLIRDCICWLSILVGLFSIFMLIYAIATKNKNTSMNIMITSIALAIFSILNMNVIPSVFDIGLDFGVGMLVVIPISVIGIILYGVSAIISGIKKKRDENEDFQYKIKPVFIIIAIIPFVMSLLVAVKEVRILIKSDVVAVYESDGNGGFDQELFVYAINDDYCEPVSIGTNLGDLSDFIIKGSEEVDKPEDIKDYDVVVDEDYIDVYKDGKSIHHCKLPSNYFNNDFVKAYNIKH